MSVLADLLTRAATLDGPILAGIILGTFAALIALPGLIVRLGAGEREESLSGRHERLDAEARAANVAAFERLGRSANR